MKYKPWTIRGEEAYQRQLARARLIDAAPEMLEALEAVGAWMASEDGPLYGLWENADIGSFENVDLEWEDTLQMMHDGQMVGGYGEPQSVAHYRQVLAAIAKARGE